MPDINGQGKLPQVLVVDDSKDFLDEVTFALSSSGLCSVTALTDSSRVLAELETGIYSALLMDWVMPVVTGSDLLPVIAKRKPSLPIIIITGANDVTTAVNCIKQGAIDYITKPLDANRLISSISNALKICELSSQNLKLQEYLLGNPLIHPECFTGIITKSEKMLSIFKLIETVSTSRYPVFITGETGVGKELIAKAVHCCSGLKGEFVPLNIAGMDSIMLDDTLFGHRKGAFTGAADSREGLIAKAKGGTLFLDEIGDLDQQSQVKLLRLLQEKEYYRLGSDLIQKSDARIVAASNRDFVKLIKDGKFREDLYHRLCHHRLHIPPLRERKGDILLLAQHFCKDASEHIGKAAPRISTELESMLFAYNYPGNVRELANRISSAVVVNQSGLLTNNDFSEMATQEEIVAAQPETSDDKAFSLHVIFPEFPTMQRIEQIMIKEALKITEGRKSAAADLLGITRQTLRKKLDEMES